MRNLVAGIAGAVLLLGAGAASAADKVRPVTNADPCGVARFNGAYLGASIGTAAHTALRTDADEYFPVEGNYSATRIGFSGGLQAGYDWQSCNKVLGVVADFNWVDSVVTTRITPNLANTTRTIQSGMDWFSTLRARAGVASGDTLFYVTGGVAAARTNLTITDIEPGVNQRNEFTNTRLGLVGGVGAEFMLGGNWSLSAEALYMQFRKANNTFRWTNDDYTFVSNDSAFVGRVGVNYRFDNPRNASASMNAERCGSSLRSGAFQRRLCRR